MKSACWCFLVVAFLTYPARGHRQGHEIPPKCEVHGTVVQAAGGAPLGKAFVLLSPVDQRMEDNYRRTTTDRAGQFSLRDVLPGRYRLHVFRRGYVDFEYGQRRPGKRGTILTLAPGQTMRELLLRLTASGVVGGRIYDAEGEPVEGAQVQLMRYGRDRGRRKLMAENQSQTNDLGEYRFYGLRPGRYFISVTPSGWFWKRPPCNSGAKDPQERYVSTYYAGTSDPNRATAIEVRAGEEVHGIDWSLTWKRGVRVRGHVLNAMTGESAKGVSVALRAAKGGGWVWDIGDLTDERGNFEIENVPPTSYSLFSFWMDGEERAFAQQALEVGDVDVDGIQLVLRRGVELLGHVAFNDGRQPKGTTLEVYLEPRDRDPDFTHGQARVGADGSFRVPEVSAGEYEITIGGLPADSYLKEMRLGKKNVLTAPLSLPADSPGARLEIGIAPNGGRVEGLVLDGENLPASGVTVVLVPPKAWREVRHFFRLVETDQYGRFLLRGIHPGEYELFAWLEVEGSAWLDPEFLALFEEMGKQVTVTAGGQHSTELKLLNEP